MKVQIEIEKGWGKNKFSSKTKIIAEVTMISSPEIFTLGKLTKKILYRYSNFGYKPQFLLKYHGYNLLNESFNMNKIEDVEIEVIPQSDYHRDNKVLYFIPTNKYNPLSLYFITNIKTKRYEWKETIIDTVTNALKWILCYKG
jgi:hypothetical protein